MVGKLIEVDIDGVLVSGKVVRENKENVYVETESGIIRCVSKNDIPD